MTDITDQEIFNAAISGTELPESAPEDTPAAEPAPIVTPEPPAQANRDEQGRFAALDEAPPAAPPQPSEPDREPTIPPARLREEAEARRKAEREADELRGQLKVLMERSAPQAPQTPAKPPIDPFTDPEGFYRDIGSQVEQVREQMRQEMRVERMNGSFDRASRDHGDAFNSALEAFAAVANPARNGGDERLRSEMLSSYDPARFVMDWHARNTLLSEIGSDPNAYRQRIIDEYLSNPENKARLAEAVAPKPAAPPAPTVKLPPSLNRSTGASSPSAQDGADVSDHELFASTVSRRR